MKLKQFALIATTIALASAVRAESYTFTPGTVIPLAPGYVQTAKCSIEGDGYAVGSTYNGSSVALSLYNTAEGDYVLSLKGGAKNLSATYSLTMTDGAGFEWTAEGEQTDTGSWTTYDEVSFLVKSLPEGELTLTLAITGTTGSYAGNYGYFKFSTIGACALAIPADADYRSSAYAKCTSCTVDSGNGSIGSVKNGSSFSVVFYCADKGWYNYSFSSGAKQDWGASSVEWTLRNAAKGPSYAENVSTTEIGGEGYEFHGGAALQNAHKIDLGILEAGIYILTATAVKNDNNYVANFGNFQFAERAYDTIVSGEEVVLGESAKGAAKDYVSLVNCKIDDSVQVIGSTYGDSSMTVALYNETAGDWTLSWLGGAKGLEATYSISVVGKSYSVGNTYTQIDTSNWTPSQSESLVLAALPEGPLELVFEVKSTTASYAGNYGHFCFVRKMPDIVVTTVTAWDDEWNDADTVTFSGDGALVVDASDYASWESATKSFRLGNSNVSGLTSSNILVALGTTQATATATFDNGTVTVTVDASSLAADTTWCGAGGDNYWGTAGNWTHGVPSETVPAKFTADATVTLAENATVKTLMLNGKILSLVGSAKHLNIDAFASDERGTIALKNAYLWSNGVQGARKDLVIPSGIAIHVLVADGNNRAEIQDNWGNVTVNGPVTLEDGARLRTLYTVSLLGGLSGNGSIDESGSGKRTFAGDWSQFTGTYTGGSDTVIFVGDFDASASSWSLPAGMQIGTSASDAGSVKFGGLTMTPSQAQTIALFKNASVEVGSGEINGNVSVTGGSLSLAKTGAGTLTLDGVSLASLAVEQGAIAAGANAPTIETLTMAAGSFVVANSSATINAGTATIGGVKVLVPDATVLTAGATYNLVDATTLSGTPAVYAVDSEGERVGSGKNWWLAKARNGKLFIRQGNPNAGFVIVIR